MGRLIDADVFGVKVIKEKRFVFQRYDMLNEQFVFETVYGDLARSIMDTPTAYDLDKVVAQLSDEKMWRDLLIYDLTFREREIIKKAIEIVKRGGINGEDD